MKAAIYEGTGGPDVIHIREVDAPVARAGEVLIDVVAAGLNRADVQQRLGLYPPPLGASDIPGLEVSGRIGTVGEGVTGFSIGDEVCALLTGGGYAERVVVPAGQVLVLPPGVDLVAAAALPEAAATVYSNLFLTAGVKQGESVLIHGASGGIGTMAVQLVRAFGAKLIVTAGSQGKLEAARLLGAEVLINYREENFVDRVREGTEGRGADVILDVVGAKYLQPNLDALATGGRLVVIGLIGGAKAEIDLRQLMTKRATIFATTLRARPAEERAAIMSAVAEHVWPLIAAGSVSAQVHRTFPLREAAKAHEYFDSGDHVGKILLTI